MRYLPTFASLIALVWAAAMVLRADRLPWLVPAYVIAQLSFTLIAFLGLQRQAAESKSYLYLFAATFGVVLLFAVGFTAWIAHAHDKVLGWFFLTAAALHVIAAAMIVHAELLKVYKQVPAALSMAVFQGGVLTFCGSVALISLALRLPPELRIATTALGFFWMALGILSFMWALGIVRNPAAWLTLNTFAGAMIAIVCFAYLGHEMGKLQAEASHAVVEPIPFENGLEAQR